MSPQWTRLADTLRFTSQQLVVMAAQLPAGTDDDLCDHIAEQSVILAAGLAIAASSALQARYPIGEGR